MHKLALENANDLRLYRYAEQLLDCRLHTCKARVGTAEATGAPLPMPMTIENTAAKHLLRWRHHLT